MPGSHADDHDRDKLARWYKDLSSNSPNFMLPWRDRQALLHTAWIVRPDEEFPRLVTCYPLQEERK